MRNAICAIDDERYTAMVTMKLWCLVITGLCAITKSDEEWFLPHLRSQILRIQGYKGAHSWKEIRILMKTFLSIDALHDKPGKELYDRALAKSHVAAIES